MSIFNSAFLNFYFSGLIATMFCIRKLHLVGSKCRDQEENCKFCFSSVWYLLHVLYCWISSAKEWLCYLFSKDFLDVTPTHDVTAWRDVTMSMLVFPRNKLSSVWTWSSFLVQPFPVVWKGTVAHKGKTQLNYSHSGISSYFGHVQNYL